ncbi:MAG: hypothetical protein HY775_08805, partial [Acidobacteria bacterium]|nr:hypothetical protein [Acidobacteriota bacterium]
MVVHPADPQIAYAALPNRDQVFKTTDGGETWVPAGAGIQFESGGSTHVYTLVMDPSNPETLYAGAYNTGVFKTTDGGATWAAASTGLLSEDIYQRSVRALAIDPLNSQTLYAGTYGGAGLLKSTDGAATWTEANAGLPPDSKVYSIAVAPSSPTTLYAALFASDGGARVFRSTDAGASWSPANEGITNTYAVFGLAVDPSSPQVVYAAPNAGEPQLFKSVDGGQSWAAATAGLAGSHMMWSIAIHPSAPSTIYLAAGSGERSFYKSTDGAASWAPSDEGIPVPEAYAHAIAIAPSDPSVLYGGTAFGAFRSDDAGTTWRGPLNHGFPADIAIMRVALSPSSPERIYAGTFNFMGLSNYYSMFVSMDGGGTWDPAGNGLPASEGVWSLAVDPTNSLVAYAGSADNTVRGPGNPGPGLFKTVNGGASWSQTGLATGWAYALAIDSGNPETVYAGTNDGVYKTTDGGVTWAPTSLSRTYGTTVSVRALALDPTDSATIYAGVDPYWAGSVFKSTDGGATWAPMSAGLVPAPTALKALAVDPSDPQTVYAGFARYMEVSGGVFKSTDGGLSWDQLNEMDVMDLIIDPADPHTLYFASHADVVFKSTDGGVTWTTFNDGLTNLSLFSLAIDPTGNKVYVGTGAGVFDYTVDKTAPGAPSILAPAEGAVLKDAAVAFSGTAEPGSSVKVLEG